MPLLSPFSRLFPFFLTLALIVVRLQGIGIVKDSLPQVPEDKELRAKNRARNEEQKKAKEAKKAKSARKTKRHETTDKNCREAEKVGLHALECPETSVSEIEGGGDTHWLNELADEEDEDEVIPPVGGGIEVTEGSRARGVSSTGGERIAPYIIVDDEEDGAPQEGSVPSGPQEGERVPTGGSEMPPQPVAPEGPIEPRPVTGAKVEGLTEAPRAKTTIRAPVPTVGETGTHSTSLSAPRGAQGAPSSQKSAAPRARYVLVFYLSFNFLFFSFFLFASFPISRKHKVASVGLAPLKAVKRVAQSTPRSARPRSPPPLSREEGELSHEEGGRRRGRRHRIPRRGRRRCRGPKSRRGQSWPLEVFPPLGDASQEGQGQPGWTEEGQIEVAPSVVPPEGPHRKGPTRPEAPAREGGGSMV